MKKMQHHKSTNITQIIGFFGLGALTGLVLLIGLARITWHSKFYPGIKIAGVPVSGLTREQARAKLIETIDNYQPRLTFNSTEWTIQPGTITFEVESSLNEAYRYGRRFNISDYLLLLVNKKVNFPVQIAEGRTDKFEQLINEIATTVEIPPIDPEIEIVGKNIKIINGVDGTVLDSSKLNKDIDTNYRQLGDEPVVIPTINVKKQLNNDQISTLKTRAKTLLGKKLTLTLDDEKIELDSPTLISLLSTSNASEIINKLTVREYATGLGERLDKDPQDARFEFVDGKVKEFRPGRDGVEVNTQSTSDSLKLKITDLVEKEEKNGVMEIAVNRTSPQVTTEKVNELGIRERIGRGESYYYHSIPNRIYNVGLASTRINSVLIGPGEEASFNQMVGEVSATTGYRQAYIIEKGRTVLGDGGGLCQVSTTMFRAAMSAGLPILERWGHAYRVSYYELDSKPGVDATVIAPSKDFRFKNDTPGHILIQTINDPKTLHLIIEIYGTSDGRESSINNHKVWGTTPALPTIYQDDPTLPSGSIKQVDWAATGAKASFEYKVVRNGETIQDKTFSTAYQPWASVFLKGTGQ